MQIKKVNVKGPKKLFSIKACSRFMDLVFNIKNQARLIDLIQAHFIMQKIRPVIYESGLTAYKNKVFYQEYMFLSVKNYAPNTCFNSEI